VASHRAAVGGKEATAQALETQGLGMGLAISRSIIEAHHGRIWVEPAPHDSGGTIVRFFLPLHVPKTARRRLSP
jgi:signal transduction histidine kinase